ncbi:MAG: response regulator, partial [Saprospiraceae bacterium]
MAISNQLRQVDKLKDQFLANTSHELRTPLNGIVGLSESLLEKIHSVEEKEDLELIISSGRRLSNLVNDILDFSRLKEHDLQLKLRPVDIRSVADLCFRMNRHILQEKELEFTISIPPSISYCLADENRLLQILQNLVANAIKFTEKGTINLQALEVDNMMVISVTDTGIGIEKDKHQNIFREFEQADGSVSREYGGTGLGLSISKYLVELHGGTIGVVSEPGKGSTFTFTIPVWKDDGSVIPEKNKDISVTLPSQVAHATNVSASIVKGNGQTQKEEGVKNGERKHILIVDDEPVNLKVLRNHLEKEGYYVTQAADGEEALQLLEKGHGFHLVLLDVMMPRIPGYEVCQKIREHYLLSELPVIMVTAKNQVDDLVEGLAVGANDYIVKPFSKNELLARVKTQLDNHDIHVATNRFVPHEFIRTLGRHNIMDLQRGDMIEQNVHVMFSDIRDYTALAEDMTPIENFKFVNSLAGKVGPMVKSNHGIINQYLGDTIMMLFMEKADQGVQAGIDILRMMTEYNQERINKKRKAIKLGIGMHSGPLMMGIIGDSFRTDAAVISDTVNTASRMEGLTKYFNANFILSEDTLNKLEDRERFHLRYLGKVQAKGKHQSLDIYECYDGDTDEQVKLKTA